MSNNPSVSHPETENNPLEALRATLIAIVGKYRDEAREKVLHWREEVKRDDCSATRGFHQYWQGKHQAYLNMVGEINTAIDNALTPPEPPAPADDKPFSAPATCELCGGDLVRKLGTIICDVCGSAYRRVPDTYDAPVAADFVYDIYDGPTYVTSRTTEQGAIEAANQLRILNPNTHYLVYEGDKTVVYDTALDAAPVPLQPPPPDYRQARGVLADAPPAPTEPPRPVKLTARNSVILRNIKAAYNNAIYKRVLEVANKDGEQAALDFLLTFYVMRDKWDTVRAALADEPPSASAAKLTAAQRKVLQHLADGDRVFRHWGKQGGQWIIKGEWGVAWATSATVNGLWKKKLVTISDREDDWRYVRLTAAGRAALESEAK